MMLSRLLAAIILWSCHFQKGLPFILPSTLFRLPPPQSQSTALAITKFNDINNIQETNSELVGGISHRQSLANNDQDSKCNDILCIPYAISSELVWRLQSDLVALEAAGFGSTAGVGSSRTQADNIRKNVKQIWLESPFSPPLNSFMGDMEARRMLLRFVREVQGKLCAEFSDHFKLQVQPADLKLELSYLSYRPGSYYQRHVDMLQTPNTTYKRMVSMILFLGAPPGDEDDRPWCVDRDGGALRIFNQHYHPEEEHETNVSILSDQEKKQQHLLESYQDIPPTLGTLLLFDSSRILHEVLETRRNRFCVVGWFGCIC